MANDATIHAWIVILQIHDSDLEGDRLELEARIKVAVSEVAGTHPRKTAWHEADRAFRALGFGPLMDRPDARVSLSLSLA
jgi:hypothetical protein